jgi:hypothetical protein
MPKMSVKDAKKLLEQEGYTVRKHESRKVHSFRIRINLLQAFLERIEANNQHKSEAIEDAIEQWLENSKK